MRPNFFKYCFSGIRGVVALVVLSAFITFYLLGLFMPSVDSLVELKILGVILGVVLSVLFIGNYVSWRKL